MKKKALKMWARSNHLPLFANLLQFLFIGIPFYCGCSNERREERREKKKWKSYQNHENSSVCVLCVHENADRNTISIVSHGDQFDRRKKLSHNSIVVLHTNKHRKQKMIAECPMLNTIDENEIETRFVFFFRLLSQSSLRSDIFSHFTFDQR